MSSSQNNLASMLVGDTSLPLININNHLGSAVVSLSGGHVMNWQPSGHTHPVLWLSGFSKFAPGKSIRGGVPICWPWFGPHSSEASFPGHGFARTVFWQALKSEELADGSSRLVLSLQHNDTSRAQWSLPSSVEYAITVGNELRLELTTRNLGTAPFVLSEALHTYFAVSDIRQTPIHGLEGCTYLDKVNGNSYKQQEGPIVINSEVDRVYVDTAAECVIEDRAWQRRIRIIKEHSLSTIVWNPWHEKAEKMGDFGPEGYLGMVCVESGNALQNSITIAPGDAHVMTVRYCIEAL
jgi:glucose-6-phosphate 1-epimerase